MDKLRVVWICNFSNTEIRSRLSFKRSWFDTMLRKFAGSSQSIENSDYGVWITNGINEMKSFNEIELHVITPHYGIVGRTQEFEIDGIHYHVYPDESYQTLWKVKSRVHFFRNDYSYKLNRRIISSLVNRIAPDIIHIIGAENINYSLSALDFGNSIPVVVQLQTLVADPLVYNTLKDNKKIVLLGEKQVLRRANYIFSIAKKYISIIKKDINPEAIFVANKLAVGVTVDRQKCNKEFDFVYCSVDISKAADLAIRAFAIAKKSFPNIKLDIIGHYSSDYKSLLDDIITKEGIQDSVTFEGRLSTHEDVLNQIKKSRFALLPLRPDLLPSTVREAMSLGCPVVTTITESSPKMNEQRESILLCKPEDPQDMADKMCLLLSDSTFAERIRQNAYLTVSERYDNHSIMKKTLASYFFLFEHFKNGTPIPEDYLS